MMFAVTTSYTTAGLFNLGLPGISAITLVQVAWFMALAQRAKQVVATRAKPDTLAMHGIHFGTVLSLSKTPINLKKAPAHAAAQPYLSGEFATNSLLSSGQSCSPSPWPLPHVLSLASLVSCMPFSPDPSAQSGRVSSSSLTAAPLPCRKPTGAPSS